MKLNVLFAFTLYSTAGVAQLTASNLPIIKIQTNGATIDDEPKVMVDIEIINNGTGNMHNITDPATDYIGKTGIEWRGNSTQGYDKKTYSLEFWKPDQTDTAVSVMGMGKEEDWILHANHIDKSFVRNFTFYDIWRKMGYWAPNTKYCELLLDGDYRGLYIWMERIKRDDDRVDIAKLNSSDNTGDEVTGGYILRLDWNDGDTTYGFESNHAAMDPIANLFYKYQYPKYDKITGAQKAYISNYIAEFEEALFNANYTNSFGKRYNQYIDMTTFADFFIVNELSRSVDAYKLSTYMHKDKDSKGGKLKAGPIWDFDLSSNNAEYCGGDNTVGWTYLQAEGSCDDLWFMPAWWGRLLADPIFVNHVRCRWEQHKTNILDVNNLHTFIDAHADTINQAQARNFNRWPILGQNIFAQPSPIPSNYGGEIQIFKDWMTDRIYWLDSNIPGDCSLDQVGVEELAQYNISIYPNPFKNEFNISNLEGVNDIKVYDITGKEVYEYITASTQITINLSSVEPGIYFVKAKSDNGKNVSKKIVKD